MSEPAPLGSGEEVLAEEARRVQRPAGSQRLGDRISPGRCRCGPEEAAAGPSFTLGTHAQACLSSLMPRPPKALFSQARQPGHPAAHLPGTDSPTPRPCGEHPAGRAGGQDPARLSLWCFLWTCPVLALVASPGPDLGHLDGGASTAHTASAHADVATLD